MKSLALSFASLFVAGAAVAQTGPVQFSARGLVALSDADLTPSALVDNNLYRERGSRDYLTLIQLPLNRNGQGFNTVSVSNSMASADKALAVSNNGRLAFVLEGRGPLPDSLASLKNGLADYPASTAMFAVDISGAKPAVKFRIPTGTGLSAIAVSPRGNTLLVASADPGKELKIIDLDPTGRPARILTSASPTPGAQITDLAFHPGGEYVAYTIGSTGEVGLMKYAVDNATKKAYLTAHGKPVKVGTMPGAGKFTPDGSLFVIADQKKAAGASGAGAGELFVVQFSTADTPGEHKIVGQTAAAESPEAMAISPDGSIVVVANTLQSYQPFGNAAAGKSSLSVFTLAKDGKLTLANEYPIDGVMPQAVEFDKTGDALAVAIPEYLDYGTRAGGIEFYRVTKGDKPTLTKEPARISVARGVHALKVIP